MKTTFPRFFILLLLVLGFGFVDEGRSEALSSPLLEKVAKRTGEIEARVLEWRRDLHRHPELGNREFRTARRVAEHLRGLGLDEVRTEVAHTGVVGLLQGGRPGSTVALRADMDALPVTEQTGLPFASEVRTTYNGQEVGVMHACGHDVHTAALMGAAQVLAELREEIPGRVLFIFQPAEEGAPAGEEGGADLMLKEGVFDPAPDAIFALHAWRFPSGVIGYRAGPAMASADGLKIRVRGRQTHAAIPWDGVDPVVVASQIVLGLQTIPSRQLDARSATIVSIGSIHGGNRRNIIPDEVLMEGTIRILDSGTRDDVLARVRRTVERIAESAGTTAEVEILPYAPVTHNDPELVREMLPTLRAVAGAENVIETLPVMPAEDFSFFQERVPGFYFLLGINRPGVTMGEAAPNHSPHFYVHEEALPLGVRALASLAAEFLARRATTD